jgi:hypothetical protein
VTGRASADAELLRVLLIAAAVIVGVGAVGLSASSAAKGKLQPEGRPVALALI